MPTADHPSGDKRFKILVLPFRAANGCSWLTRRLVREVMLAAFDNEFLRPLADGAVLPAIDGRVVFTTDSYVVSPLFFPGGDIGKFAVHGTVDELAVCGAEPLYLSLGLIAEEGLPLDTLWRVVGSVRDLVSGTIGDHGIAVLSAREALDLGGTLASDTAPVHGLVAALFESGADVRFLRDPTRGGVSAALHELAEGSGVEVVVDERALPLSAPVRGACEILGLDPLYVANEGKLLAVVAAGDCGRALSALRRHPQGGTPLSSVR